MPNLDLIDVVRIAREFAEEAGWGFFRAQDVTYDKAKNSWILTAYLGAFTDKLMRFVIDDRKGKVTEYGAA